MRRTIPHTTVALAALTLALAGCGGQTDSGKGGDSTSVSSSPSPTPTSTPTPSPSPKTSLPAPPPTSPADCARASTLDVADSGHTVCLAVGETVRISLDGTAKRPWKPVSAKGSGLEAVNSGFVLLPGDASAAFKAVAAGKARLQSTRPLCATQAGRVSCMGIQEWWVTVVVK